MFVCSRGGTAMPWPSRRGSGRLQFWAGPKCWLQAAAGCPCRGLAQVSAKARTSSNLHATASYEAGSEPLRTNFGKFHHLYGIFVDLTH